MTTKQSRFVDEYMIDLNANQAAIRAGYSPKTARFQGSRLLSNVDVARELELRQQERAERTQTDADWVIGELVANHAIAREKGDIGGSTRALELIGKHHGAFLDRVSTEPAVINVEIIRPAVNGERP